MSLQSILDVYMRIGLVLTKTEDAAFQKLKTHHFTKLVSVLLYYNTV